MLMHILFIVMLYNLKTTVVIMQIIVMMNADAYYCYGAIYNAYLC